jgi:hypothetical protein
MFVPKDLTPEGRGVGWSVFKEGERAPEMIYASDGSSVGGSSVPVIYPDQKVVISWVMNTDDFSIDERICERLRCDASNVKICCLKRDIEQLIRSACDLPIHGNL